MLIGLVIFAQLTVLAAGRQWEDGPLTWNDFQGEPLSMGSLTSELSYQLSYVNTRSQVRDTTVMGFKTRNSINRKSSWVGQNYRTGDVLRYNQILFDILELHRRFLQYELNRIENVVVAEEKLRTQYDLCNVAITQFRQESEMGLNVAALDYWEKLIKGRLEANPLEILPDVEMRDFGFNMHGGMGAGVLTSSLHDDFSNPILFGYGFDLMYKKSVFALNAVLGSNKTNHEVIGKDFTWPGDLSTTIAMLDLSAGYTIYEKGSHRLVPNAGLGIFEFSVAGNDEQYKKQTEVKFGLSYGLTYDFKFKHMLNLIPSPFLSRSKEFSDHAIRVRLDVRPGSLNTSSGTSVSFTVGYALLGRTYGYK